MRHLLLALSLSGCASLPAPAANTPPAVAERCGADVEKNDLAFGVEMASASVTVASSTAGWVGNNGSNGGFTAAMLVTAAAGFVSTVISAFVVKKTSSDYANDGCVSATGPVPHPEVLPARP